MVYVNFNVVDNGYGDDDDDIAGCLYLTMTMTMTITKRLLLVEQCDQLAGHLHVGRPMPFRPIRHLKTLTFKLLDKFSLVCL